MTNTRVLIVEDNAALRALLLDNVTYEGYLVESTQDAESALLRARHAPPDLMLSDLMPKDGDGLDVCQTINADYPRTSIIILTSRREPLAKVAGLDMGVVMRRTHPAVGRLDLDGVLVDFVGRTATKAGTHLALTTREFELLQYLAERHGTVVTRQELLKMVWGYEESALTRTVDIFIGRLRRKIEPDPKHPRHILTSHGDGYLLVV